MGPNRADQIHMFGDWNQSIKVLKENQKNQSVTLSARGFSLAGGNDPVRLGPSG
jgi:hypothetical protein